jgi:hypothetical protein
VPQLIDFVTDQILRDQSVASPSVKILGVYSPRESAADFQAFLETWTDGLDEDDIGDMTPEELTEVRHNIERELGNAVLVEALVEHPDKTFSIAEFAQPNRDLPSKNWQIAWGEKYLTPDGSRLLGEYDFDEVPSEPSFRVAFYIHYWNHENGLNGPYGPLELTSVQPMPARLWKLARYESID